MTSADRRRRRRAAALAASTVAHAVILGLLARHTPALYPVQIATRDFQVELVPASRVPPVGQAVRQGAAPETAAPVTPRPAKRSERHTDVQTTTPYPLPARGGAVRPPRPPSALAKPTPPTPATSRAMATGTGASGQSAGARGAAGAAQGQGNGSQGEDDDGSERFRGALRTSVGCDDPDYFNLSKAERAVCFRGAAMQAAIGSKQYVDPISSAKVRNQYDQAREACERLNHYATPLDSDRDHSASAPGNWGIAKLHC